LNLSQMWRSIRGRHTLDLSHAVYYADIPFARTPIGDVTITPITRDQWRNVAWLSPPLEQRSPALPIPSEWTANVVNDAFEPLLPATHVNLTQIQAFIDILNAETGLTFRLPTRQEAFQMAVADFEEDPFLLIPRDLDQLGTFAWQPFQPPVGTSRLSTWGLYDTIGCIWQWCNDGPADESVIQPSGTIYTYPRRWITGGSWRDRARDVVPNALGGQGSFSFAAHAAVSGRDVGFRLIRDQKDNRKGPEAASDNSTTKV